MRRSCDNCSHLRNPAQSTLPDVLARAEVHRMLTAVRTSLDGTYMWTAHCCGSRLNKKLLLHLLVAATHYWLFELSWPIKIATPAQPKLEISRAERGQAMTLIRYGPTRPACWIAWPWSQPPQRSLAPSITWCTGRARQPICDRCANAFYALPETSGKNRVLTRCRMRSIAKLNHFENRGMRARTYGAVEFRQGNPLGVPISPRCGRHHL